VARERSFTAGEGENKISKQDLEGREKEIRRKIGETRGTVKSGGKRDNSRVRPLKEFRQWVFESERFRIPEGRRVRIDQCPGEGVKTNWTG